jgi:hypothetical protein
MHRINRGQPSKLFPRIAKAVDNARPYEQRGEMGGNYKPPPVRNGPVSTCVWLACALQYFAGGRHMTSWHSMDFLMCQCWRIWAVVEAVNSCDESSIEYPESKTAQLKITHDFENVSKVKFSNCAGAIDGILIWILKPSEEDANEAGCGRRIFFVVARENLG